MVVNVKNQIAEVVVAHPSNPKKNENPRRINVEIIRSLEKLDPYRDAWDRLVLASPQRLPMLSWAWATSFFEHFLNPDERWMCLLAIDDGRLIGVLPLIIKPHRLFKWCPQLRTPNDPHTHYYADILAATGYESKVHRLFLAALSKTMPLWFGLKMTRVPENSPTLDILLRHPRRMSALNEFQGWASYLKLGKSFQEFQAGLSHNLLRQIRRTQKRLDSLPGIKFVFHTNNDVTEKDFEWFMNLESSGWKGEKNTAISKSLMMVAFYKDLTRALATSGWLEFHFLETDGKIIAGQLAIRLCRTLISYKIAYDEAYADYSPGSMLEWHTIERAFELGDTDEINCLTDMPAHGRLRMLKRSHVTLFIFPKQPLTILAGLIPAKLRIMLTQEMKRVLQRVPGFKKIFNLTSRIKNYLMNKVR